MARKKTRAGVRRRQGSQEIRIEHTEDDNILPDIGDLERLEIIKPGATDWFFDKAAKEQDHRHKKELKAMESLDSTNRGIMRVNFLGISFAFLFMIAGLAASYSLIMNDKEVIGIFAGGLLITICGMFLSKVKSNNDEVTPGNSPKS